MTPPPPPPPPPPALILLGSYSLHTQVCIFASAGSAGAMSVAPANLAL